MGVIAAEGVAGGDAFNGSVEIGEKLLGDARGDFGAVTPTHHVFIGNDDAMGFADGGGDGFPVVRREGAKIDDFNGDAFAFERRGGNFSAANNGAVSNDADLLTFFDKTGFAKGDGEIRAGIFGAGVGLAVKMFVFEEHHGIVAADRSTQQTGNIESGGRHDDAQAGAMGKDGFAALAVIDGAPGEVATNGHANDHGALESAVRAPAKNAELIANLHHGGPDVIEELNFGDGFQTASGHADCAANDSSFGQWRVKYPIGAVFAL